MMITGRYHNLIFLLTMSCDAAALFSMKKGTIMAYVKKRAFLRLGALTARDGVATPKTQGYQEYLTGRSVRPEFMTILNFALVITVV